MAAINEENMDAAELENIFIDIFVKCDNENEGSVEVSTLIKFIAPFIDSNDEHLCELKKILDPLDINPIISYDLFSNAMKIWTAKFNSQLQTSLTSSDKSVTNKRSDQLRQSTPTKDSIETGANKNDFDCGLNISNISSYSYAGSVQSTCDPLILNEQINELQHQNRKLTDLLSEVRSQLAAAEEFNNNMQGDLDKLKKGRQTDQKLIEDLQKMRTYFEKEREENSMQLKNYNSIIQSLNFYKKENSQLKKNLLDCETEIQKNQETITSLRHKEDKQREKIKNYKQEIQMKTTDILSFEEKFREIHIVCSEKDSVIKKITEELENLRSDNNSLQQSLDDFTNKNTSLKSDLIKSDSETNPEKRACISLGPEVVFDDEYFQDQFNSCKSPSPLPQESLQSELIKASNTVCFGSHTVCEHKLQLIKFEEENENLHDLIRGYINEIDKMKLNISDINHLNTELQNQISLLTENQKSNNVALNGKVQQLQEDNEEMATINIKLKSDIASIKSENKRYSRLQQKIKKLEDDIFEEKTTSERILMEKNALQSKINEMYLTLEQNKLDLTQLLEKDSDLKLISFENTELKSKNNELCSKIKNLEQIKSQLEDKVLQEKNCSKELQLNNDELFPKIKKLEQMISQLEDKVLQEKNCSKELQLNIKELFSKIGVLEQTKQLLEEKLSKEENNSKELILNISNLSSKIKSLEETKLKVEEKLYKEKNNAKELKTELNDLTSYVQKLEKGENISKEQHLREESEMKQLKFKLNDLSVKTEILEQTKYQLEEKLAKEENNTKILKTTINQLSSEMQELKEKLCKEESNVKELKEEINELTSKIRKLENTKYQFIEQQKKEENETKQLKLKLNDLSVKTEILEQTKYQLEEKLAKEENHTKILKTTINQLSSEMQELQEKLCKEESNVKELKEEINELTSKIQKLEKSKYQFIEQQKKEENETKQLKLNDISVKTEILEQMKYQLEEKLIKEENATKQLKLKILEISSNLEILEQTKHHLEDQLTKEENKLKLVSANLNELAIENKKLKLQNDKSFSKNKKLLLNIETLEKKIQSFRKSNIDLKTVNNDIENSLRQISNQRDSLLSHISYTKEQIKKCTDLLGKNTLLVSRAWRSDLETIISEELPISDLMDEVSLSDVMRISEGKISEDLKNLKHQTHLTGILLKYFAKMKQSETLDEEDVELSGVFSPDSAPLVTQATFFSNTQGFSLYLSNFSSPSSSSSPLMSPECTQSEMTEEENHFTCVDLTQPGVNVSSPTGSVFIPESSEENNDVEVVPQDVNGHVVEEAAGVSENKAEKPLLKQYRSMSEGTTAPLVTEEGDITLFPNLQDHVLESLGLQNGEQSRERSSERMSEEELEAKFQTLALIFAIDARTLAQRRELQRRQRDQADDNFAAEVARLEHGIQRLAPLCVDAEITELVTALLTRLNIIVKAAQRISISTQVYGGVQQEYRVAAAVNMMLVHLRNVQQQRDTARRQLQLTKKMLQENTVAESTSAAVSAVSAVTRRLSTAASGRVVTRRRASIANIPRPLDSPSASGPAGIAAAAKRSVRRISADAYTEHSAKSWEWMALERPVPPVRLARPSRIELNLDLSKIHEGSVESTANNNEGSDSDNNAYDTPIAILPSPNLFIEHQPIVREPETFSDHAIDVLTSAARFIIYCWNRWMKNGTTREMILFAVFLCFAFGSIMILNMMIVAKFIRQGTTIQRIPWGWMTWDELWSSLFDVRNSGPW